MMRVDSTTDLERVKGSGKVAVLPGVQDSEHFRSVDDVNFFHGLGQRVSQLTYNARNLIGNGSTERRDEGFSDFGVAIVERTNTVGMTVDVSHCGDRTTLDAFEFRKSTVLIRLPIAARLCRGLATKAATASRKSAISNH
jgi:membrane dipeptidase